MTKYSKLEVIKQSTWWLETGSLSNTTQMVRLESFQDMGKDQEWIKLLNKIRLIIRRRQGRLKQVQRWEVIVWWRGLMKLWNKVILLLWKILVKVALRWAIKCWILKRVWRLQEIRRQVNIKWVILPKEKLWSEWWKKKEIKETPPETQTKRLTKI